MKIVMTLLARDEEDIVDQQIRFHLERGVAFVVATDHRSTDGTTEILRRYEREGHLHLTREEADECPQSEWVTRMARLAATEYAADWVVNSDADEFWIPRGGTLEDVLGAVPPRFGAIRAMARHFVLRPETSDPFYERMIVRRLPTTESTSPYQPSVKVLHRADPSVLVPNGNHDALGRQLLLMREWCPIDVLHFPIRSRAQMFRKFSVWRPEIAKTRVGLHARAASKAIDAGQIDQLFDQLLVDDPRLEDGLEDGTLVVDTRVRDAMRRLDGEWPQSSSSADAETPLLITELGMLMATDAAVKLATRLESFDARLSKVESSPFVPAARSRRRAL